MCVTQKYIIFFLLVFNFLCSGSLFCQDKDKETKLLTRQFILNYISTINPNFKTCVFKDLSDTGSLKDILPEKDPSIKVELIECQMIESNSNQQESYYDINIDIDKDMEESTTILVDSKEEPSILGSDLGSFSDLKKEEKSFLLKQIREKRFGFLLDLKVKDRLKYLTYLFNLSNIQFVLYIAKYVKSTIRHIRKELDLSDFIWQTRRYLAMNQDISSRMKEHIYNIAFLWPSSIFIEVLLAPATAVAGTLLHVPATILIPTVTLLSVAAFPGICPIFMVVLTLYQFGPVQDSVSKLRKLVVKVATYKIPFMDKISLISKQDRIKYLLENKDNFYKLTGYRIDITETGINVIDQNNQMVIQIGYTYGARTQAYISWINLDKKFLQNLTKEQKLVLKEFGQNLYRFLKTTFLKPKIPTFGEDNMFFVEDIKAISTTKSETVLIRFKNEAMFFPDKIECIKLFSKND